MTFKTSHIILILIALFALSQGENVRKTMAKGQQINEQRSEFNDRLRQNKEEARNAKKLSQIALDRFRANCILVADATTGKEAFFQEGALVGDVEGTNRMLREGAIVCNSLGDTAEIDAHGAITDIARVSTEDIPQMKALLAQTSLGRFQR
ncbi:MAG: hypothetical protein KME16_27535 [Scytolyngbya sp. HA4215-MV1]|nr:hypothetical protein [Scytolyngbya sp. HA4215-MV1]